MTSDDPIEYHSGLTVYRYITAASGDGQSRFRRLDSSHELWNPIANFTDSIPEGGPVVIGSKNAPIYGCFYEVPLYSGESIQTVRLYASSERVYLAEWARGSSWIVVSDLLELVELQARWSHLHVNPPMDTRLVPSTEVARFGKDGFRVVAVLSPNEVVMERESRTGQ